MDSDSKISASGPTLESWARDGEAVAIVLRQRLEPAEGAGAVIFPPTYANIGYNTSVLSDGTRMCMLDTVASQANRIEPLFAKAPLDEFVPQFKILFDGKDEGKTVQKSVSLFEAGHRLADAVVRCSRPIDGGVDLAASARDAFRKAHLEGITSAMAKIAPTSLIFGLWDSRESHVKVPRIVQSVIRAWDVSVLRHAVNYVPPIDYRAEGLVDPSFFEKGEEQTGGKAGKKAASKEGFANALDDGDKGGIVVHGEIRRELTINLGAVRKLRGETETETARLREYILTLALLAAVQPFDGDLRSGCLLVAAQSTWEIVRHDGTRESITLNPAELLALARAKAAAFGVGASGVVQFDPKLAQLACKNADSDGSGKRGRKKSATASAADGSDDQGEVGAAA